MNFTRFTILLLMISLCISLIGCGKQNASQPTKPSSQDSTNDTTEETPPEDNDSDLTASDGSATKPDNDTQPAGNETKPTEKPENDPSKPVQITPPDAPTEDVTHPNETEPNPSQPNASQPEPTAQAYAAYYNMSAQEQQAFIDSFGSIEAFFAWHTIAKKAYEDARTPIDGFNPIIP